MHAIEWDGVEAVRQAEMIDLGEYEARCKTWLRDLSVPNGTRAVYLEYDPTFANTGAFFSDTYEPELFPETDWQAQFFADVSGPRLPVDFHSDTLPTRCSGTLYGARILGALGRAWAFSPIRDVAVAVGYHEQVGNTYLHDPYSTDVPVELIRGGLRQLAGPDAGADGFSYALRSFERSTLECSQMFTRPERKLWDLVFGMMRRAGYQIAASDDFVEKASALPARSYVTGWIDDGTHHLALGADAPEDVITGIVVTHPPNWPR